MQHPTQSEHIPKTDVSHIWDTSIIQQTVQKNLPKIIQGGMGINVSSPGLANTVSGISESEYETLGTISWTTLDRVVARQLQIGWIDAQNIITALSDFPFPEVAERVIQKYAYNPRQGIPVFTVKPSKDLIELTVCANYAFVKMAKKWHKNPVSINYLEKVQMPHLVSIYGAMLAEVDYVTMWAGIPLGIPAVFDAYAEGREATYKISVTGSIDYEMTFDPKEFFWDTIPEVKRPRFIPIISTDVLAKILNTKLTQWKIFGFSIEAPTAGWHNAPPRDKITKEYWPKDNVNFEKMKDLWLPYWLAGSYASPEGLQQAQELGAVGIQAGSIFALSEESGMRSDLKQQVIEAALSGTLKVNTDFRASPTGFPFKIAEIPGTMSDTLMQKTRKRVCDECALREPYMRESATIWYRCPSEPEEIFQKKWWILTDTFGRLCLCNGLAAATGFKDEEVPIITLGDDTSFIRELVKEGKKSYSAIDAVKYLFWEKT